MLRQWALRENNVTKTVQGLRANALALADAFAQRNAQKAGRCIDAYWQQKKAMAPRAEPVQVQAMLEVLRPFVTGATLAGAGGGGFLVGITKRAGMQATIRDALLGDARTASMRWSVHSIAVDRSGLWVRRVPDRSSGASASGGASRGEAGQ